MRGEMRNDRVDILSEMPNDRVNILTIDVEEWFHVLEADGPHGREAWPTLDSRVEASCDLLLGMLADAGVTATFFCVGWVADRHPALIRRIAAQGHELASHSYWHEVLARHTRSSLRADLERSKKLLEDESGAEVSGFRAPGGSITLQTAWSLEVLAELGFRYDASLNPGHSSHGGYPTPFRVPHLLRCAAGELAEIPWSTLGPDRWQFPYAGGGYLRLLPYPVVRAALAAANRRGRTTTVYVHPRELDLGQPRITLPLLRRFKYYVGIRSTQPKLRGLLRDFSFTSARRWLADHESEWRSRVLDVRTATAAATPSPDPRHVPPAPPGIDVAPLESVR
jgi:polysaccharide deacetylase family protein (PEP-CTERM system associated)